VEAHGDHVAELRCWSVGQGRYAAAATVVSIRPKSSAVYRATLAVDDRLAWVSFDNRGAAGAPTSPELIHGIERQPRATDPGDQRAAMMLSMEAGLPGIRSSVG
jgi:hypothetical protein